MAKEINVLFVCLGNICRSPMAEAVLRHRIKERGLKKLISVDSAGTGSWHVGERPHKGTLNILEVNDISSEGIRARQITQNDGQQFDYIIAMDNQNLADIKALFPNHHNLYLFNSFLGSQADILDPWYTHNFEVCYSDIDKGCQALIDHLETHHDTK